MFPQPAYSDLRDVEIQRCARVVVETCLDLKPKETVVIVGDTHQSLRLELGLMSAAYSCGAIPTLLISPAAEWLAEEPDPVVAAAMKSADAVLVVNTRSLTHTSALDEARKAGARVLSAPAMQEDNFLRTTDIDYQELAGRVRKIEKVFKEGLSFQLTSKSGTNLKGEFGYRVQATDGYCRNPGDFDQLSAGAIGRAPIESSVEGRIVSEPGRSGLLGVNMGRVEFVIREGRIVEILGESEAKRIKNILEGYDDPNMFNIAEIGTGANPRARFTGFPMEDRRMIGAVHIGLGDNQRFFGGKVKACSHFDMAVLDHTLLINGQEIIVDGKLIL